MTRDIAHIRAEFEKRGITAYEACKTVDITEPALLAILSGESNPRAKTLKKLSDFLWPPKEVKGEVEETLVGKEWRFEDVLAQKIIDALKPYIEETHEIQADKEKLLKDMVNLLKAQMVNISNLQSQVDLLKKKIDHIEAVSEQSNQVLLGRN